MKTLLASLALVVAVGGTTATAASSLQPTIRGIDLQPARDIHQPAANTVQNNVAKTCAVQCAAGDFQGEQLED